jgi:hypothetical protein
MENDILNAEAVGRAHADPIMGVILNDHRE